MLEIGKSSNCGTQALRKSASGEIADALCAIAEKAEVVAIEVTNRLSCIAVDRKEEVPICTAPGEMQGYPSLFASYREQIDRVNSALAKIECVLSMIELP